MTENDRLEMLEMAASVADRDKYDQCTDEYSIAVFTISRCLSNSEIESLTQLVNGPVFDGDVISKTIRDNLIKYKLATRCCYKGKQGFTAGTYRGFEVLHAIDRK